MNRQSDFVGAFRALADDINAALRGGPDAWTALITRNRDNDHPLMRMLELSIQWVPGKAPPATIFADWRPNGSGDGSGRFTISPNGDMLVGFVRLKSAESPTELQLTIGGQDFGGVTLLKNAGSFAFAHVDRFMVPLINLRFHEVRVCPSTPDDMSVGIVWACFDSVERRDMSVRGAFSILDDATGAAAIYQFGTGSIGSMGSIGSIGSIGTLADKHVELPDMRILTDLGSKDRSVARCDRIRKELMAAAWHPRRLRTWCLEHDDEFAVSRTAVQDDAIDAIGVLTLDGFLTPEECACMMSELGEQPGPPTLVPAPTSTLALVLARLDAAMPNGAPWKIHGTQVAYGDTSDGMHSHRDEAYQGGGPDARTLLLYLTGCGDGGNGGNGGGATVFECDEDWNAQVERVLPIAGRAVVFHVRRKHHAEPVEGGWRKVIAALEIESSGVHFAPHPPGP